MRFIRLRRAPRRTLLKGALPGFDANFYLRWYPDVLRYAGGPLEHYVIHGWREGRDPSAGFSTARYLAHHADVRASGVNPLIHFLENGLAEGRGGWEKDPAVPPPQPKFIPEGQAPGRDRG